MGFPIRTPADQRICAPPRGFSQLIAAFIAMRLHRHPPWTYLSLDHIAPPPPFRGGGRLVLFLSPSFPLPVKHPPAPRGAVRYGD